MRPRAIAIVLLTALLGVVFAHPMAQGRRPGKISAGLRARVASGARVPVIIELKAQPDDAPDLPRAHAIARGIARAQEGFLIRTPGYGHIKRLISLPIVAIEVDARVLADLDADPDVVSVTLDARRKPSLMTSVPLIGAPTAWALGASGAGWSIAVLDTGVAKQHPFLAGKVVSEACYGTNTATAASTCPGAVEGSTAVGSGLPCPASVIGCNHGTHVAGIAAGHSSTLSGVARDGSIIAIKIFSRIDDPNFCFPDASPCAGAFDSDILAGLDRVYALRTQFDIAAVNLSLGGGEYTGNCDADEPAYKTAIDLLRSVDIATVIASGNGGSTSTMGVPACISSAVAVGASTKADVLATYTDRSPLLKLLAPGSNIYSSVPGGGFATFSGTSMAAPHVAGAWAVLKSRNPAASVTEVQTALTSTGLPIADAANARTWPRIRVGNAVQSVPLGPPVVTSLIASPELPQLAYVPIAWTARAVGGAGTLQYKFWVYTASTDTWTVLRDYSTSRSVVWTPTVPGTYAVRVWVRTLGSSADFEASLSSGNFSIDSLGTTNFILNSQPGDYVGGGQHIVRSGAGAAMSLQTTFGEGAWILYQASTPSVSFWTFHFAAPGGQVLIPGVYKSARRWTGQLFAVPNLDVSGDGRGCNTLTGRFVVLDVERVNDLYTRFAADFEQHCEGAAPALFGSVRFNSAVPPSERPVAIQSFKPSPALPAKVGVPMTWTATAIGGGAPLQYKFLLYSKATNTTTVVQDGPSNALVWTPPRVGTHKVQVWVRSTGSQAPYEASASSAEFTVAPGPVQITAFGANVALPTPVNTIIMWTAAATGGSGNLEYQFWRYRASTNIWTLVQKYSALNTFTWQPSAAEAGTYALQVRVRSVGSTVAWGAMRSTGNFVITAGP